MTQLRTGRIEIGAVRTLIMRGHLERAARPGRGLLEDQHDIASDQPLRFAPLTFGLLELGRQVEQIGPLVAGEVEFGEEMTRMQVRHAGKPNAWPIEAALTAAIGTVGGTHG